MAADPASLGTLGLKRSNLVQRDAAPPVPNALPGDALPAVRALWSAYRSGGQRAMVALAGRRVAWLPEGPGGRVVRGQETRRASVLAADANEARVRAAPISFEAVGRAVIVHGRIMVDRGGQTRQEARHWVFRFRPARFRAHKLASVEAFPDRASALNHLVQEET